MSSYDDDLTEGAHLSTPRLVQYSSSSEDGPMQSLVPYSSSSEEGSGQRLVAYPSSSEPEKDEQTSEHIAKVASSEAHASTSSAPAQQSSPARPSTPANPFASRPSGSQPPLGASSHDRRWEPTLHREFQPGDPEFTTFRSYTVFEAEECTLQRMYQEPEGEGTTVAAEGFYRMSATDKYLEWCSRLGDDNQKNAPRMIRLVEHFPCGVKSEPAEWASKVKTLRNVWANSWAPGTEITIIIDVTDNPWNRIGNAIVWYEAIVQLAIEFPGTFKIEVEDSSISELSPADQRQYDGNEYYVCLSIIQFINELSTGTPDT